LWYLQQLKEMAQLIQLQLRSPSNSPIDLCTYGVRQLEDNPLFNAGRGAKLQADGKARLSCAIMNGAAHRFAGVSNIEGFDHPSEISLSLMEERDRNLIGREASRYAMSLGKNLHSPVTVERYMEWKKNKEGRTGTVGCIALCPEGKTAAMTSTGGRGMERPGRMSDSATPAGNFANHFGAASCTGAGEDILEAGLAISVLTRLEDHMNLQEAVSRSFLRHRNRSFGMIALDYKGNAIVHATRGTLGFGVVTPEQIFYGLSAADWLKVIKLHQY